MRNLGIWAAGYRPEMVADASPRDVAALAKLGYSVIFSAVWAMISWGLASTIYSGELPTSQRWAVAASAGLFGFVFILLFDRTTLFLMDCTKLSRRSTIIWIVLRITIIASVGSFVDAATMPNLMRQELAQEALHRREASDSERQVKLTQQFNVPARQQKLDNAEQQVSKVEEALRTIPLPIKVDLERGHQCYVQLSGIRKALKNQGYDSYQIAGIVAGRSRNCAAIQHQANAALSDYKQETSARLAEVRSTAADARSAYGEANGEVANRLKAGRETEAETLTEDNIGIFWLLVTSNFGAAMKAIALFIFQLSLELLPFLMKGMAGRSSLGLGLAEEHEQDHKNAEAAAEIAAHETQVKVASSAAAASGMLGALARPSFKLHMENLAERDAMAMSHLDQAIVTFQRIAEKERQFEKIKVKTPQLRALKLETWIKAVAQSLTDAARA